MKKILVLMSLGPSMVLCAGGVTENKKIVQKPGSVYEGIARVTSEKLSNVVNWLKGASESDQQALLDMVAYKLDKIGGRIDTLKEQIEKKLSAEQKKELQTLKSKVVAQIEKIHTMTPEMKKKWREQLKFKFDQLPQDIMLLQKKFEAVLPEDANEKFDELHGKAAKLVDWIKNLPQTDKEALKQALQEKTEKLEKRVSVLKQLGRDVEYEEIKGKIADFITKVKENTGDIKDKAVELYEKAIEALKGGKK